MSRCTPGTRWGSSGRTVAASRACSRSCATNSTPTRATSSCPPPGRSRTWRRRRPRSRHPRSSSCSMAIANSVMSNVPSRQQKGPRPRIPSRAPRSPRSIIASRRSVAMRRTHARRRCWPGSECPHRASTSRWRSFRAACGCDSTSRRRSCAARTSCFWMSRRTTSTSMRCCGSKTGSRAFPARSCSSPTIGTSSMAWWTRSSTSTPRNCACMPATTRNSSANARCSWRRSRRPT